MKTLLIKLLPVMALVSSTMLLAQEHQAGSTSQTGKYDVIEKELMNVIIPMDFEPGAIPVKRRSNGAHQTSNVKSDPSRTILWDNGPLITHPGGGAGGADASAVQTAIGMSLFGANANHNAAPGDYYYLADDFEFTTPWTINTINFYAYQTGSTTTSPFTGVYVQIWDGPPDDPGSSVVCGDLTTNRMISTSFTNIYRVFDTNLTNTQRPIMEVVAELTGCDMLHGIYWVQYGLTGNLTVGPWVAPVSILGETTTGNGLQKTEAGWQSIVDGGSNAQQGIPFVIEGIINGEPANDIGVLEIISPTTGYNLGADEPVAFTVKNFGLKSQSNIPWTIDWNGGSLSGAYAGPLHPGQIAQIDAGTANLSAHGVYEFEACTNNPGDENPYNNCKTKTVVNSEAIMVYPQSIPYWTGTTDGTSFTENSLVKGINAEDGWFIFDVSSIPSGSEIINIRFHGYVYETNYPYWSLTPLYLNPLTATPEELSAAIAAGEGQAVAYAYNNESSGFAPGWHDYPLVGTANADLEAALDQGWFAMGMASRDNSATYFINFYGWNEANVPYLEVEYIPSETPCGPPPQNLQAEVVNNVNVAITWNHYVACDWLHWDSGENNDGIGLADGGTFLVAARWTPGDLAPYNGYHIKRFSLFPRSNYQATFEMKIWEGANASTLLVSVPLTSLVQHQWNSIELALPVAIDATKELWVGYEVTNTADDYPAGIDNGPAIAGFGDKISLDGGASWMNLSDFGLDYNWNIQICVAEPEDGRVAQPLANNSSFYNPAAQPVLGHLKPMGGASANRLRSLLGFKVYRNSSEIGETISTWYYDENLSPGTYAYTVKAIYPDCLSDPSCPAVVTILPQGDPIEFNPPALFESHPEPNLITNQTLTVSNTGDMPLAFEITVQRSAITLPDPTDPQVYAEALAQRMAGEGALLNLGKSASGGMSPNMTDDEVIRYDDGVNFDAIGLTAGGTFHVAAYFPASTMGQHYGKKLFQVEIYINDVPNPLELNIYGHGTSSSPGPLLHSQPVTATPESWIMIELTNTVDITGEDLWIGYTLTHPVNQFPAGIDNGPAVAGFGDMISIDGITWEPISFYGLNYNWNIAGYLISFPLYTDVGVHAIVQPTSGIELGTAEPVIIKIINYGNTIQSHIPWTISWSGTGGGSLYGTHAGPLAPGADIDITAGTANLSTYGAYTFEACTHLVGDQNPANNCKTKMVVNMENGLCIDNLYTSGCSYGDQLTSWSLVNISVPSIPCSGTPPWYQDYTDLVHELQAGQTYQLTVTAGYSDTHFAVWIDFDGNLDLTPDELLLTGVCATANTTYTFDLTIPANAGDGTFVLRARTNWLNPATDPCATYTYGNCCDFSAQIGGGTGTEWLSASPLNGYLLPGESMPITVTFNSNDLLPDIYQGDLKFETNDPLSPHFIPVTLTVVPEFPCFTIDPLVLTELHNNPPQVSTTSLMLENSCATSIEFVIDIAYTEQVGNAKTNQWLTVNPNSGTITPGQILEIDVGFNSGGLFSPGVYIAELIISANDPNSPYFVPVTLELTGCDLPPVEDFTCEYIGSSTILLEWSPPQSDQHILRWDDGFNYTGIGLIEGGTFMAAARWDTGQLAPYQNWNLTHIAFFPRAAEATFVLQVLFDDLLIVSQPVINFNHNAWNTIELDEPVQISGLQELFIGYEVTHDAGIYPAGCDAGPAVPGYGDLVTGGTLSGFGLDYNWNLAGYISQGKTDQKTVLQHQRDGKAALLGYNVYRNGEMIATMSPDVTSFVDFDPPGGIPEFIIGAVYDECISMSEPCTPVINPILSVNPSNFDISLVQGEILTEYLFVSNTGHPQSSLDYLITIEYSKGISETRGWLSVSPQSGVIQGNGTHTINVMVNTQNLSLGSHEATIVVTANFPNIIVKEIPVLVDITLSAKELHQFEFSVSPNPTSGIFTIEGSANHAKVTVFNAHGVEVYHGEQTLPAVIDLTEQPRGIYFIRIETDTKSCFEKVVIN